MLSIILFVNFLLQQTPPINQFILSNEILMKDNEIIVSISNGPTFDYNDGSLACTLTELNLSCFGVGPAKIRINDNSNSSEFEAKNGEKFACIFRDIIKKCTVAKTID